MLRQNKSHKIPVGSSGLAVSSLLLSDPLQKVEVRRRNPPSFMGQQTPSSSSWRGSVSTCHMVSPVPVWGPVLSETWGNWEMNIHGAALHLPHPPASPKRQETWAREDQSSMFKTLGMMRYTCPGSHLRSHSKMSCRPWGTTDSCPQGPEAKAAPLRLQPLENSLGLENSQEPSRPPVLGYQGRLPFSPTRLKEDWGRPTFCRAPFIQNRGDGLSVARCPNSPRTAGFPET